MKPGIIYKIYIKNFVTYSEVEIYPGPNLNIVIGPNGTGKSTIVAAIILGLGGSPKIIGRGTKVSEYVRHDCDESKIDIDLYGEQPNLLYTVTRIFNISNQSNWYINKQHVSEADVKKLCKKLKIQVNNLCQFLPQDRVQDFAKMNKKELLVNTQIALGREDLVDKHTQLIDIRKEEKGVSNNIENIKTKLEQAEIEIQRLEGRVKNLQEKRKYISEMDSIKRKIHWQEYKKLLDAKLSIEKDRKQAEKLLNKHKKKMEPAKAKISELHNKIKTLQTKLLDIRSDICKLEAQIKTYLESSMDVQNSQKLVIHEMNTHLQALAERNHELDAMKAKIDKIVNDENSLIEKYGDESMIERKAIQLLQDSNIFRAKLENINQERLTALNLMKLTAEQVKLLDKKEQDIENVKLRRLQILKRRDAHAHNAVLWLKDNRHLFRGQVYDPIMLELNVINPAHTKYLENIIPMRDRVAFTCEYREDMNLLLQSVRDQQNLRINAVHSGSDHPALENYRPSIPIEHLKKFGFFAYVNSLITGPENIIKYLCRMYSIHTIPIGDKSTYKKASQVPDQIRLFFSDTHRFAVNISRYSGVKSTKISEAQSDGTFSVCIDFNILNGIKKERSTLIAKQTKIQRKIEETDNQKQALENQRKELLVERYNILQHKDQIKAIRDRLITSRRTLNEYLQDNKSADQIRQEAAQKIKVAVKKSVQTHKKILDVFNNYNKQIEKEELIHLELNIINEQIANLEYEVHELKIEYENVQSTYDQIENAYTAAVREANNAMREAKKLSDGFAIEDRGFDQFRARHKSLPSDIEELNSLMVDIQTKIECILTADDNELKNYETGLKLVESCRADLSAMERKIIELNKKMKTLYQQWIEPLEELVSKIDKNFGEYFESLDCAGEVQISKAAGEEDYSEYGLCIRVTYRKEDPLQELNRYVQSGGERAVATAVFMISMQDMTAAPFRCVDEINQGMDPQNERRIFEILVTATTKPDTCQYFLITPKLLSSLKFTGGMNVSIVHNGPHCELGKTYSMRSLIERRMIQNTSHK